MRARVVRVPTAGRPGGWYWLVGFVAEGIVVVDTGVKSRVAGGDTSMHGMQSLDRVAKGHNGG